MHKNSKKKLQSKKEVVHTRLDSPIYLRKLVLRAAIDSTKALKDYNELKMIREEKKRVMSFLVEKVQEIRNRMKRLEERDLPKIHEPHKHKLEESHEEIKISEPLPAAKIVTKEENEVDKLKRELEQIEGKLKSL